VAWRARHSAQRARDGEPRMISLSAFNEFRGRQFDRQEKQEVISTGRSTIFTLIYLLPVLGVLYGNPVLNVIGKWLLSVSSKSRPLRDCAKTTSHRCGSQTVVPRGEWSVVGQHKLPHLLVGKPLAFFVLFSQQTSIDSKYLCRFGCTNVLEDGLEVIALQGAARPIVADLRKQTMFTE